MPTTFAVFSDVHANLPALEAVLADLDARLGRGEVDAAYCLGDLVGYATWPNEVVASVQERGIPTIAGNYDEGVGLGSDDCGCAYATDDDKARGAESIAYTNAVVTDATRRYLRGLPRHLRVTLAAPRGKAAAPVDVLMVHGSPRRINEYLFADTPDRTLAARMDDAGADVMLFGHTHRPYHRVIPREGPLGGPGGRARHAINTGSVGKPKDGDPRACYVLVTVDAERADDAYCAVEVVRVPYDVEAAALAVEAEAQLPDAFAAMLREAR